MVEVQNSSDMCLLTRHNENNGQKVKHLKDDNNESLFSFLSEKYKTDVQKLQDLNITKVNTRTRVCTVIDNLIDSLNDIDIVSESDNIIEKYKIYYETKIKKLLNKI